jgi:glycosyltransferase involved in cell wall biosynthesis
VLHRGDAVGRHTLRLRDATRRKGIESNIFVDVVQDETAEETLPAVSYADRAQRGDVVVYQFATASLMAPWLAGRNETLVVNYHNITPPELMAPWDHHLALGQERAREDLAVLAPRTMLAIADSAYNEMHLAEAGFAATAVVPPSAAVGEDVTSTARETAQIPDDDTRTGAVWLAVGRVAPNKALEHAIAALAVARQHHDERATLRIVGKPATNTYERALRRYVADLGLEQAVTFTGYATDAAVASAYTETDVLVVTSEHEGFGVPVVEAMAAGLPVVAFDQGAVPEVLGDAGVLVTSRDPYSIADAIDTLLAEPTTRKSLADAGRTRFSELDLPHAADRFVDLLVTVREHGTAGRR